MPIIGVPIDQSLVFRPGVPENTLGLVGRWTFQDLSFPTIDVSGGGNPGRKNGTTLTFADGYVGILPALKFDGTTARLTSTNQYTGLGTWSCMAWAYKTATGIGTIMGQVNSSFTTATFAFGIGPPSAQSEYTVASSGNAITQSNYDTASLNAWHHVALTYDQSALRYYVDGIIDTTQTARTGVPDVPAGNNFAIGRPGAFNGNYFGGSLHDVRLYGRALTAEEIFSVYISGAMFMQNYAEGDSVAMQNPQVPFFMFDWPVPYGPLEV